MLRKPGKQLSVTALNWMEVTSSSTLGQPLYETTLTLRFP